MVESKSIILQMIPHTLFIEWDFRTLFTTLFTNRLLFMTLFTNRCEVTVKIYGTVLVYDIVHIYDTIHTTNFFLYMFIFRFI